MKNSFLILHQTEGNFVSFLHTFIAALETTFILWMRIPNHYVIVFDVDTVCAQVIITAIKAVVSRVKNSFVAIVTTKHFLEKRHVLNCLHQLLQADNVCEDGFGKVCVNR